MSRFKMVDLTEYFNQSACVVSGRKGLRWSPQARELWPDMPQGSKRYHGIPFRLSKAAEGSKENSFIALTRNTKKVAIPLSGIANYVCILHFCDIDAEPESVPIGEELADYTLRYTDGKECSRTIRRRFEVNSFGGPRRWTNFASLHYSAFTALKEQDRNRMGFGRFEAGVDRAFASPFSSDVYALKIIRPDVSLSQLTFEWKGKLSVGILGVTLYTGPGHPLRLERRNLFKISLPASEKTPLGEVIAEVDMGEVTDVQADPETRNPRWLERTTAGLGKASKEQDTATLLVEAAVARGATLKVKSGSGKAHSFDMEEAYRSQKAKSTDGLAGIQVLHPQRNWLTVKVVDESNGELTPTRIHFSGKNGEYLPPHGHHAKVNTRWFEDYAGEVKLGDMSYAYVPGEFQIELPYGDVFVELSKGFEYRPVRKKVGIKAGMRNLEITIPRQMDLRKDGWVTADTHVHFISPQTAWLEGQAEGLNLVNLLASQWGRLFTNVADISGEASGCSKGETIVWVGTENRHHMLGHLSMLGTKGLPVFPMCTGGPNEAYIGDPESTLLTEWAQRVRQQGGAAIRPHFPGPICEDPTYFIHELLDGVEIRSCGSPDEGPESSLSLAEWYRYLNCGYRVAVAGGTDKMSAATPVGGSRTYAKLLPQDDFSFESWAKAVRAGRTFVSNGPVVMLEVEGREIGEEIQLPESGGTLGIKASAQSVWPIHKLEIIVNGKVVEDVRTSSDDTSLQIKHKLAVRESCWIAARCTSRLEKHHIMMGSGNLGAHTSPIYINVGDREIFNPSDALYMLTLLEGTITYLDVLGTRVSENRHDEMISLVQEAQHRLAHRLKVNH